MRGKRELPRKRPPFLLFVLIFAAGFLAGTLFWHFRSFDASVPSGGTATLPEGPAETDVSSEPEIPPAPPQEEGPSAEPTPFVISFLGDCTLTSSHHTNHFEKLVGDDYAYPFSNVAELLLADDLTLANLECSFSPRRLESDSEYAFCGDPQYVQSLVLGGVEAVTLSNNHTRDFGDAGLRDTEAALAHAAVKGGADVVVGTHPHVLQPIEAYQGSVILYSIGNFCFGGNRNPSDKDTVIAQLTVSGTGEDRSWEMSYIPCCVSSVSNRNDYRPTPYPPDTAAYRRCFQKLDGTFRPPAPKPEAAETAPLPEPTLDAEPLSPLPDGGVICDPPAKPEE